MPRRGLTVSPQGQLLRDGTPFRNIGLNMGGAITPIYSQPSATACAYTTSADQDAMLATAVSMKVRILRVKATPYWPAQWRYGVNGGVAGVAATIGDREAHYAKLDAFIEKCRALDIGVILTLFFRVASVSDLAGQTVRAGWLTNGSATRNYAQAVTQEIVTRYINEDSVYGYEFSNELNHYNDASDAAMGNYPGINTVYGSQAAYTAANTVFNNAELSGVLSWWYGVVSALDQNRIVMTGNGPNSYSRPGGIAGIPTPMIEWHREQVRDNPTNCGSIHYYGNIGYGSNNFRGLNGVLTGARHWQRTNGRGFVLGEFGNQPWTITNIVGDGNVATFSVSAQCPVEVGDTFQVGGTTFDGSYTVATVNSARNTITAASKTAGSWSGSVKGFQYMSGERVKRMCKDIIGSGTDVALFWMIDSDSGSPIWESIDYSGNEAQRAAILDANTALGW